MYLFCASSTLRGQSSIVLYYIIQWLITEKLSVVVNFLGLDFVTVVILSCYLLAIRKPIFA